MKTVFNAFVHPWLCDVMNHLTTRHYMAIFDDASMQFYTRATGWDMNSPDWHMTGWADVFHEINYLSEVNVGTAIHIDVAITAMGRSSVSTEYNMITTVTNTLAATMKAKTVFFDLEKRASRPLSDEMCSKLEQFSDA